MSGCVDKMAGCSAEESTKEKPLRKRRHVSGEKVCQVCGDHALAHHYGALSCGTCKAFFYRHALQKVPRKCVFSGDCVINVRTRQFCPSCRLAKCFSAGMQPHLIMDSARSDSTSAGHRLSPSPLPARLASSVEPLKPANGSHNLVEPVSPLHSSQNLLEWDSNSASMGDNKSRGLSSPPELFGRLTPDPFHCTPAVPSLDTWQSALTLPPSATQTPLASRVSPAAASECSPDPWQSALTPPPPATKPPLASRVSPAAALKCSPKPWRSARTPPPPATQTPLASRVSPAAALKCSPDPWPSAPTPPPRATKIPLVSRVSPIAASECSPDTWQSALTPTPPATQTPLARRASPAAVSKSSPNICQVALTPPPHANQTPLVSCVSPAAAPECSPDTWQSALTTPPPATQTPLASHVNLAAASECSPDTCQSALTPPPNATQSQPTNHFSAAPASASVCSPDAWQSGLTPPPPATQTPLANAASVSGGRQQERRPAAHFEHVAPHLLPSDPFLYWRLTDEERSLLAQLSSAYQDTVLSVLKGGPPRRPIDQEFVKVEVLSRKLEEDAHTIVDFAKRMEDFRQLQKDEQIALIKASSYQVLGIRASALYITEKDAWVTSLGYYTAEQRKILVPGYPLMNQTAQFNRIMKSIAKNDATLYALLHCLVLFDPCDERVIDRQLVNNIRDKYVILLQHYLASVYSYRYYEKYMVALQENLSLYRSLCEEVRDLIDEWFPGVPSKLLVEILDM